VQRKAAALFYANSRTGCVHGSFQLVQIRFQCIIAGFRTAVTSSQLIYSLEYGAAGNRSLSPDRSVPLNPRLLTQ